MHNEPLGVYIHIPFCLQKCRYCDFCSVAGSSEGLRAAYVQRLVCEIRTASDKGRAVDTVFFGGGTPSLLSPSEITAVMDAVRDTFSVTTDAEITVEANPATLTDAFLDACCTSGVNRFSLGLQSINENEQKLLGRIHTTQDFYDSMHLLHRHGFENVNVDIMYGIPDQTRESLMRTVEAVLSVEPTHVSAYSLILEEGTQLYRMRDTLVLPDEDAELAMHEALCERLAASGFSRYEISNFCLDGYACRHNMKYWTMQPYIGFGAAAHSFLGDRRIEHSSDIGAYIRGEAPLSHAVTEADARFEYAMLALRTSQGISLADYRRRFGVDFTEGRETLLERLRAMGYLVIDREHVHFTECGMYVSNSLLTEIL